MTKSQSKNGFDKEYHPRTVNDQLSESSSQTDNDQVLYASPMSILNQPDESDNYLRRKSSLDADVRQDINNAPEYEFRKPRTQVEQYRQGSGGLKRPMPIPEQKLRNLGRTLETSRSRYIAHLMQGNSAVIPSSRRRERQ